MRLPVLLALFVAAPAFAQDAAPPPPPTQIAGVVTDAETGRPLAGAGVMLTELGIGTISDREGRFVFDDVPVGTHAIRVGAYTYHFERIEVEKTDGAAVTLDTALRPGAGVGCEVLHSHDEAGGLHNTDG